MNDVREAIRRGEIKPNRKLGQNFLTDKKIAAQIVNAAELTPDDHVIEVGPGVCALTGSLCEQAGSVAAVEIDRRFAQTIGDATSRFDNFSLIIGDILDISPDLLLPQDGGKNRTVKLVSNLPYYISTPFMTRLFEEFTFVRKAVLMMQTDVSRKLLANPSTPDYCMLTVLARQYYALKKLFTVAPHAFVPQPNVESAVMLLDARQTPLNEAAADRDMFFRAVRAAFTSRRKTLANSLLLAGLASARSEAEKAIAVAGIAAGARGESLEAGEYAALARVLTAMRRQRVNCT